MPEFSVSKISGTSLSHDGRGAILKFVDSDGQEISLKISTLDLASTVHEIGFLLTKSRELSDISKQSIVPFLRPQKVRAELTTDNVTVVTSYQLPSGLEHHYGMTPNLAEALARQILDAAERGKKTTAPSHH